MTPIQNWLQDSTKLLEAEGISSARLDCLILLEDLLGKDRTFILAHDEHKLSLNQALVLDKQLQARLTHEPLAYIRQRSEFFARDFYIDHRVLEPRPESEVMLELLKTFPDTNNVIVDIGTGSGAIAVSAKLLYPSARVIGTDIDSNCLDVARKNARLHQAKVEFFKGNLLEPLKSEHLSNYVLLANLPYVPDSFQINPAAMREPKIAIFGGKDGLDLYRQLFKQIDGLHGHKPTHVLSESMPPQHPQLEQIAAASGYKLSGQDGFIQVLTLQLAGRGRPNSDVDR